MSNKYTDAEREAIMATAHDLLARGTEPYTPPPDEQLRRRRFDPSPEPERRRERRPTDAMVQRMADAAAATPQAQDWTQWESWLQARIDAALEQERAQLLAAVVVIVGDALGAMLGDSVERERQRYEREISELRREAAKLNSAVEALHGLLGGTERSKTAVIDLPQLPLRPRGDLN